MDTPFIQTQDGGAAGDPFAQVVDELRAGQRVRTQGLKGRRAGMCSPACMAR